MGPQNVRDCRIRNHASEIRDSALDSLLPDFMPKDPIFQEEIFDHILLLTIDPASEDQEQQLPGLQGHLHCFLRICSENLQNPAKPTRCQASVHATSLLGKQLYSNHLLHG